MYYKTKSNNIFRKKKDIPWFTKSLKRASKKNKSCI